MSLDQYKVDQFKNRIGEKFAIEGKGGQVEVELVIAKPHNTDAIPGLAPRAPFSLLFRGPGNVYLTADIYNLRHKDLGLILGVFLTPVMTPAGFESQDQPRFFEVVFN